MPVLPPGTYNVTVRAPGFQTHTRTGVVVSAEAVTRVDAAMHFGCGDRKGDGLGLGCNTPRTGLMFRVTERLGLDLRADMFNVANTPHHSLGNSSVNSGTFMQAVGIVNTGLEGNRAAGGAIFAADDLVTLRLPR
jgi:hypothetical protein